MNAVIFGGGKIARGFVAQLLYRSGIHITFVEMNAGLVDRLNERGAYYVNVMGNEGESEWIKDFSCLKLDDIQGIAEALQSADLAFTSVGGKNLGSLAKTIAEAYRISLQKADAHIFNIVTCENWKDPATQLRAAILEALEGDAAQKLFDDNVGVSEAVIMRSGVEATEEVLKVDPNAVSVTNFWELPIDRSRIKGDPVMFGGVEYRDNFAGFLQQKVYTFNTTNATIAYIGRLRGIEDLCTAANDTEIVEIVKHVHEEINPAIAAEMGISLEEQEAFSLKALHKYQDRSVTDFTERHARDPLRKIGPVDRIVGSLRLIQKHGGSCEWLATTLAAALFYPVTNPDDPSAEKLQKMRDTEGISEILRQVSEIQPDEMLAKIVLERIDFLKERGWLS